MSNRSSTLLARSCTFEEFVKTNTALIAKSTSRYDRIFSQYSSKLLKSTTLFMDEAGSTLEKINQSLRDQDHLVEQKALLVKNQKWVYWTTLEKKQFLLDTIPSQIRTLDSPPFCKN